MRFKKNKKNINSRQDRFDSQEQEQQQQQQQQPSIATFFSPQKSSDQTPSSNQKRKLSIQSSIHSPSPSSSSKRQNLEKQIINLISSSPPHSQEDQPNFAIPVGPSNFTKSKDVLGSKNDDLKPEDLIFDEGDEFVVPPELNQGEDDDDWELNSTRSDDSITLRGESVKSEDEDQSSTSKGKRNSNHLGIQKQESNLTCPICQESLDTLKTLDAERHVNDCLDQSMNSSNLSKQKTRLTPSLETSNSKPIKSGDAFGALMAGKVEQQAWNLSDQQSNRSKKLQTKKTNSISSEVLDRKKVVPFYKIMEGTSISVDAFKYGKIPNVTAYFLSHAHADHYTNLSSSWRHGMIYCSLTTANLIKHNLGVKKEWVRALKEDEPILIDGVRVTLIDANHCPGSSLFLFEGLTQKDSKPFTYLHCGDFRASPVQLRHPALRDKKIDICYLDTTYLNPKYCFPAQAQVVKACAELVRSRVIDEDKKILISDSQSRENLKSGEMLKGWLKSQNDKKKPIKMEEAEDVITKAKEDVKIKTNPSSESSDQPTVARIFQMNNFKKQDPQAKESILILIGTYTIGKEKIVKEIAKTINSRIYCDTRKSLIFKCIEDPELHHLMTDDPFKAQVHVTNLFSIKREMLEDYLRRFRGHFTHIIGLRPTGWSFKPTANPNDLTNDSHPSVSKVIEMFNDHQSKKNQQFNQVNLYPQRDSTETCQAFGVPYSEHSSFYELTCFCVSMDWVKIIPTVNCGNPTSRAKMKYWIDKWKLERKRRIENGLSCFIEPRSEHYW